VGFAAITHCVASQQVFIVVSVCFFITQSGNIWIFIRVYDTFYCLVMPVASSTGPRRFAYNPNNSPSVLMK
jgi:hypothetical protein